MLGKEKKKSAAETNTISTLLGRDAVFEGTLWFKESIRVDGHIKGKLISSEGCLIVGENAVIDADIQVAVAVIRGHVNGRIEAVERIEIFAPAQVTGDLVAPSMAIDSGVIFNGRCNMSNGSDCRIKAIEKTAIGQENGMAGNQEDSKNL